MGIDEVRTEEPGPLVVDVGRVAGLVDFQGLPKVYRPFLGAVVNHEGKVIPDAVPLLGDPDVDLLHAFPGGRQALARMDDQAARVAQHGFRAGAGRGGQNDDGEQGATSRCGALGAEISGTGCRKGRGVRSGGRGTVIVCRAHVGPVGFRGIRGEWQATLLNPAPGAHVPLLVGNMAVRGAVHSRVASAVAARGRVPPAQELERAPGSPRTNRW